MVSSPCTAFCEMENNICKACGRTKEHLLNWITYTEAERLKIMSELEANKKHEPRKRR